MRNLFYYIKITVFLFLAGGVVILSSCGNEEDEPLPARPSIEFDGGTSATTAERGDEVTISLDINAAAGIKSLTVDGTDITVDTEAETEAVDYTYTVANDAEFGAIELTFELTDDRDRTASQVFTINVIGSTVEVTADIAADVTWEAENTYMLMSSITVNPGATLTIDPGTQIYANYSDTEPVRLKIEGSIQAVGTDSDPIVFTSSRALQGTAEAGDWMGVRIEGAAGVNTGALSYVRIEYAGADDQAAALRFDDVASPTQIDHIQIFRSSGFGIDIRGGSFDMKYILISQSGDMGIEFDDGSEGFTGTVQFLIINNSEGIHQDWDIQARDGADTYIANMTMLGAGADALNDAGDGNLDQSAMRLRDDVDGFRIFNSIFAEYAEDGLRLDTNENPESTEDPYNPIADYVTDINGDFVVAYSYFFRIGDQITRDNTEESGDFTGSMQLPFQTDAATWFNSISDETPAEAAGIGIDDFVPDAAIASEENFDPSSLAGTGFESAPFVGAIGSTDWTLGWAINNDGSVRE